MLRRLSLCAVLGLAILLAGCVENSATGSVRGRVLTADGQPLAGARVALDSMDGRATLSNFRGEFRLGGARDGGHQVFALDQSAQFAAAALVEVEKGSVSDVGDLILQECVVILSGGGPAGQIGGPEPNGYGGAGDATIPCNGEPPPPPPATIHFDSITADYADGYVDPSALYGFANDSSQQVGFDFYVLGDFTTGGEVAATHVDNGGNGFSGGASMGLYTFSDYGYYYVLREGDLTVTVEEDGDGDPATMKFSFTGENLIFDYLTWDTGIDPAHTATAGLASADGLALQFIPPDPPTGDITFDTFNSDWREIYLCTACGMAGGDLLLVYAYDPVHQSDLSLVMPVSSLTVPGTAAISGTTTDVFGSASVATPGGSSWYYSLFHVTVTVSSAGTIAVGSPLTISFAEAQFDYQWAGGVFEDGVGGGPPGSEPLLHLFLGAGDLSSEVRDMAAGDPTVH